MPGGIIATEESLIIETPERVQLEFALASIGNRFLAVALDHVIQFISIFFVAWFFLSLAGYGITNSDQLFAEAPKWVIALMIITLFLIFAGYFIVFEWLWNGQTPGKRWLRLRVIRDDGRPLTL
ncbi:MAG: RDD family protein, partial [Acidobacteria bacterium]|nr:RDD family protein [Acidobacteriota bacterium]